MTDINDATDERPTLFPKVPGFRTYLVRVNPRHRSIPDPITGEEFYDSLHNIETCIGDDVLTRVDEVIEHLLPFIELPGAYSEAKRRLFAEVHIWNVLHHPKSPYGLGYQPKKLKDPGMFVMYHRRLYVRDRDGVMVDTGERLDDWPKPDQWRVGNFRVRLWARREGLLP